MKLKRFGEKKVDGVHFGFLEFDNGDTQECSENIIEGLWWKWVSDKGAYRDDDDEYTVFAYKSPIDYETTLQEGLDIVKNIE